MLGYQEIIIILVIALLVFGPHKLPEIGRQVGNALREFRKMSGDIQKTLDLDGHLDNSWRYDSSPMHYESPSYGTTYSQSSAPAIAASPTEEDEEAEDLDGEPRRLRKATSAVSDDKTTVAAQDHDAETAGEGSSVNPDKHLYAYGSVREDNDAEPAPWEQHRYDGEDAGGKHHPAPDAGTTSTRNTATASTPVAETTPAMPGQHKEL